MRHFLYVPLFGLLTALSVADQDYTQYVNVLLVLTLSASPPSALTISIAAEPQMAGTCFLALLRVGTIWSNIISDILINHPSRPIQRRETRS
jgi:hypothetical protein